MDRCPQCNTRKKSYWGRTAGRLDGRGSFGGSKEVAPRASDELLETTKGLEVTQQQGVDQLQVVQDQLVAQQTETKKLSEQIATLNALQQSVANIPAPLLQCQSNYRKPSLRRDSAIRAGGFKPGPARFAYTYGLNS